jgi:hypothetical protein
MENSIIGKWEIEYDKIGTMEAYNKCGSIIQGCYCDGCQNYYIASHFCANEIKIFFEKMGIDITKPIDTNAWGIYKNGKILYGGFYYIVGKILKGDNCFVENKDTNLYTQKNMYKINDDLEIGFTFSKSLSNEHFPKNTFQMEILYWVPWMLENKKFIKDFLIK